MMSEFLVKVLPVLASVVGIFLLGSAAGKKKYKQQAEEEIRKAKYEAGKAKAEAATANKEKRILEAAAKAVSPQPEQKVVEGDTREKVMGIIDEIIKESRSRES